MPPARGPAVLGGTLAGLVAALCCVGLTIGLGGVAGASATSSLREGVYAGAADPSGVRAFDAATGTHSTIAADYLPTNSGWSGMDGTDGSLSWMFAGGWAGTGLTLSLGVPIIPTDHANHPVGTLAIGATGAYNPYFVTLAQTLVRAGESNAYLRLGWEFDGTWTPWNATGAATETRYAEYFRQIVDAMRSVTGEHFRFVWNPDAAAFTTNGYDVSLAYPGNSYVNEIGLDSYDQSWVDPRSPTNAWNETVLPALTAGHSFAAAHGKPLAIAEWGTAIRADGHGLGDDPLYVSNMIAWMRDPANDVAYETYFDYDGRGTDSAITSGRFPRSLSAFRTSFHQTFVAKSSSKEWYGLGAALLAVGTATLWMRRVHGRRRIDRTPQLVYPSPQRVRTVPFREWVEANDRGA